MHVLRPLPALRLHGRRQGSADEHADAGARNAKEFPAAHGELGPAHRAQGRTRYRHSVHRRSGQEFFQPAGTVVLASFTLNNTRLLALSKIGTPYDPVARKGTLGRNLTHQVGTNTRVFFDKPLNAFMGAGELGARISDFDGDIGLSGDEDGLLRVGMIALSSNGDAPI